MTRVSRFGLALLTALSALSMSTGLEAQRAGGKARRNVEGTWALEVTMPAGVTTPTVTFKQQGEKLTGHYSSSTFGEQEVTGTLKGNQISFSTTFTAQLRQGPTQMTVSFTGVVPNNNEMSGDTKITPGNAGKFVAKRQEQK